MMVRITYADHTTREVELTDVMFGDEEVEARGPVLFATPITRYESDGGPVAAGRSARSAVRAAMPVYGTGRTR